MTDEELPGEVPQSARTCSYLERGERLGAYRIIEHIGEGGMGSVYRAEHALLGRQVAIKTLLCDLIPNRDVLRRFFAEARAACEVQHESVVDITDFVEQPEGGRYYFVMEYLEGESLSDRIQRDGALAQGASITIAKQVARGLMAVHEAEVIHRDLKPGNIFLAKKRDGQEQVKLLDFGISKLRIDVPDRPHGIELATTAAGVLLGTPAYMSPEQASGKSIDHRTDIYSFGVILYEMLTGELPFDGEDYGDLFLKLLKEDVPRPSESSGLLEPLSSDFEELVLSCLEKDPNERLQSMQAVLGALVALEDDIPVVLPGAARVSTEPPRKSDPPPATNAVEARDSSSSKGSAPSGDSKFSQKRFFIAGVIAVALILGGAMLLSNQGDESRETHAGAGSQSGAIIATSSPPAEPELISVRLVTEPQGAEVRNADTGAILGQTPLEMELVRSVGVRLLRLQLAGYQPTTKRLDLSRNSTSFVQLIAIEATGDASPDAGIDGGDLVPLPHMSSSTSVGAPSSSHQVEQPSSSSDAGTPSADSEAASTPHPSPYERGGVIDPFRNEVE